MWNCYFVPSVIVKLKEKILNTFERKSLIWWRTKGNILFIWEHPEESLEKIFQQIEHFSSDGNDEFFRCKYNIGRQMSLLNLSTHTSF